MLAENSYIQKTKVVEIKMQRCLCEPTMKDKTKNEVIQNKVRMTPVKDKMR